LIYGQNNGNYTTARASSTAESTTSNNNRLGQLIEAVTYFSVNRLYFLFDTSTIGAGSTVTQANLKLTVYQDYSDTDFDIVIMKQDWSGGTREEQYDACLAGTPDDNILRNTSGISNNTTYTSGNLSTAWVSKTGTTYYSVISSRDVAGNQPSGNEYVNIYMQAIGTAGYRPTLSVTYTVPATGHPAVNRFSQIKFANGYKGV